MNGLAKNIALIIISLFISHNGFGELVLEDTGLQPKNNYYYDGPLNITRSWDFLEGEELEDEETFAEYLQLNVEVMEKVYAMIKDTHKGKVLATDTARQLLPAFNENQAKYNAATYQPASAFIKYLVHTRLENPPAKKHKEGALDIKPKFLLVGGGPGSGKSFSIERFKLHEEVDLIYDSLISNIDDVKDKIDDAKKNRWRVYMLFIYRPIEHAVKGAVVRAKETGRPVSLQHMSEYHYKAQRNFLELEEHYGDRVEFIVMDNSNNEYNVVEDPVDFLRQDGVLIETISDAHERAIPVYLANRSILNDEQRAYFEAYLEDDIELWQMCEALDLLKPEEWAQIRQDPNSELYRNVTATEFWDDPNDLEGSITNTTACN